MLVGNGDDAAVVAPQTWSAGALIERGDCPSRSSSGGGASISAGDVGGVPCMAVEVPSPSFAKKQNILFFVVVAHDRVIVLATVVIVTTGEIVVDAALLADGSDNRDRRHELSSVASECRLKLLLRRLAVRRLRGMRETRLRIIPQSALNQAQ